MSEIQARLAETSQQCLKAYEQWRSDEKNDKSQEELQSAIHELRKVASRLEIELAISERDNNAQKKLPIPPHRANRKKHNPNQGDDNSAQASDEADNGVEVQQAKPRRTRRTVKKAAEG